MRDANAIADLVIENASSALRGLELIMTSWPAEFRAIMWHAVVLEAQKRQRDAEAEKQRGK